jgi:excisionase family DNA binding protein
MPNWKSPFASVAECGPKTRIVSALERRESALKAPEIAKLLGVTRQQVYKMAAKGIIPSFRVGAAVRFDPDLIAEWLRRKMANQSVAPQPQRIAV